MEYLQTQKKVVPLHRFRKQSFLKKFGKVVEWSITVKEVWKGGRVVDYSGLENRRAERHRGFESLPFRVRRE